MGIGNGIHLGEQEEKTLRQLVEEFYTEKRIADIHGKKADNLKDEIKSIMAEQEIELFEADGFTAKRAVQERVTVIPERLLRKLHEMGLEDCIEMKEVPNEELIEDKIYTGDLDAQVLTGCTETKEIVVLTVKYREVKK